MNIDQILLAVTVMITATVVAGSVRLCENSDGVQGMMSKFYLIRAKHDCDFSFAHFAI